MTCLIITCASRIAAKGYCNRHYKSWKRYGDPLAAKIRQKSNYIETLYKTPISEAKKCSVIDCSLRHFAKTFCQKHYQRFRKYGDPLFTKIAAPGTSVGRITKEGYRELPYIYDHPNARADGRILEHILVMSTHIGRALLPGENVHHLNGQRSDNRIENLELWSTSQPPGQRLDDKTQWAIEWLQQYKPEALTEEFKSGSTKEA